MSFGRPLDVVFPSGLVLTAAVSVTDTAIHKMFGSGCLGFDLTFSITTLIASNEEINYIMKLVKLYEESNLLRKGVSETTKN